MTESIDRPGPGDVYAEFSTLLQGPHAVYSGDAFYFNDALPGVGQFRVDDYLGVFLKGSPNPFDQTARLSRLQEGSAWIGIDEGATMSQDDVSSSEPVLDYSIFVPERVVEDYEFLTDKARRWWEREVGVFDPGQPVIYRVREEKAVPNPFEDKVLAAIYRHVRALNRQL